MKMKLSAEQELAVNQGCPVEVINPASGCALVVVARRPFERVRSFLE